jgi:hypothetical protein
LTVREEAKEGLDHHGDGGGGNDGDGDQPTENAFEESLEHTQTEGRPRETESSTQQEDQEQSMDIPTDATRVLAPFSAPLVATALAHHREEWYSTDSEGNWDAVGEEEEEEEEHLVVPPTTAAHHASEDTAGAGMRVQEEGEQLHAEEGTKQGTDGQTSHVDRGKGLETGARRVEKRRLRKEQRTAAQRAVLATSRKGGDWDADW